MILAEFTTQKNSLNFALFRIYAGILIMGITFNYYPRKRLTKSDIAYNWGSRSIQHRFGTGKDRFHYKLKSRNFQKNQKTLFSGLFGSVLHKTDSKVLLRNQTMSPFTLA